MAVKCTCPHCKAPLNVQDQHVGKSVRCPKCQQVFQVTAPPVKPVVPPVVYEAELVEPGPVEPARTEPSAIRKEMTNAGSVWDQAMQPAQARRGQRHRQRSPEPSGSPVAWIIIGVVGGIFLLGGLTLAGTLLLSLYIGPRSAVTTTEKTKGPVNPRPLADFKEPNKPFRPGTMVNLREAKSFKAPGNVVQMVFSAKHDLLFLRNSGSGIWVVDTTTGKNLGMQASVEKFSDLSLAPNESCLYAADYGRERVGYGTPINRHWVHRYDLRARRWEKRQAPKIAYRIEAVDDERFILLERDQWVEATLNHWNEGAKTVTEVHRARSDYYGDIEYDPRTGRMYHGNSGSSSPEIHVLRVVGEKLSPDGETKSYGSASKGGGTAVLSTDGMRFYYGPLQVEAMHVTNNTNQFPERIHAAADDLAFGEKAYYDSHTGRQRGKLPFATKVYGLSKDGLSLWAFDPDAAVLHMYAIRN